MSDNSREQDSTPERTEETSTNVPAGTQPRLDNQFVITVGAASRQFNLNINELHRASPLFRENPIVTSIELRDGNPEAVELIWKWFSDALDEPPFTEEARDLYHEAAEIARQLQIRECEDQFMVIIRKAISTFQQILEEQIRTGRVWTQEQIREYVGLEMEGYMARSTNEEGEEGSEESDLNDLLRELDEQ